MSGAIVSVVRVAQFVSRRLPPGLREVGAGRVLKKELEIAGFTVEREQPVIVLYAASDGTQICAQTGFIDFIVRGENNVACGIELKVARTVTPAHANRASGYAAALRIPVVAVAMHGGDCETMVLNE